MNRSFRIISTALLAILTLSLTSKAEFHGAACRKAKVVPYVDDTMRTDSNDTQLLYTFDADVDIEVVTRDTLKLCSKSSKISSVKVSQAGFVECIVGDTVFVISNDNGPSLSSIDIVTERLQAIQLGSEVQNIYFYRHIDGLHIVGDGWNLRLYDNNLQLRDYFPYFNSASSSGRSILASRQSNQSAISWLNVDTSHFSFEEIRWPGHRYLSGAAYCIGVRSRILGVVDCTVSEIEDDVYVVIQLDSFTKLADSLGHSALFLTISGLNKLTCASYRAAFIGSSSKRAVFALVPDSCTNQIEFDVLLDIDLESLKAHVIYLFNPCSMSDELSNEHEQYYLEWTNGTSYLVDDECLRLVAQWPTPNGWHFQVLNLPAHK